MPTEQRDPQLLRELKASARYSIEDVLLPFDGTPQPFHVWLPLGRYVSADGTPTRPMQPGDWVLIQHDATVGHHQVLSLGRFLHQKRLTDDTRKALDGRPYARVAVYCSRDEDGRWDQLRRSTLPTGVIHAFWTVDVRAVLTFEQQCQLIDRCEPGTTIYA